MEGQKFKEPIRKPWIWVVLLVIIALGVPWYLPQGKIYPIIFGFPYWAAISVLMSIILAAYLSYLCKNQWYIVEDEEEEKRKREV